MKIAFVLKGNIRRRRLFERQLRRLKDAFPEAEVNVLESKHAGQSRELAASLCGQCDYLVAVGGDGTINEAVNGCFNAHLTNPALKLPHFAILAHGTANDMARSLGLTGRMRALCKLLEQGQTRYIDIGKLQCASTSGKFLERLFVNMADIGIGAEVTQQLGKRSCYLGSNLHYLNATLSTFLSYEHKELSVTFDGQSQWQGKTLALVVANGRYFGSGLCVAPGATLNDGQFFTTLIGNASTVDFVRNLRRLKKGIPLNHPEVRYDHAHKLEIDSEGVPAPIEVDGELIGVTPATFSILPLAVSFVAPPAPDCDIP